MQHCHVILHESVHVPLLTCQYSSQPGVALLRRAAFVHSSLQRSVIRWAAGEVADCLADVRLSIMHALHEQECCYSFCADGTVAYATRR